MMLELLVSSAVRTLVLAVIVGLVISVLRVRQPRLQLIAWTAVLGVSLVMPMLERAPAIIVPAAISLPPALAEFVPIKPMATAAPAAQADTGKATAPRPSPFAWRLWLSVLYLAVAVVLLLRLMMGLALSWRLLREAAPVRDGWAAGGPVHASAAITTPVTIGRTVVLPVDCSGWTAATQRAVLAHERSHVARGDFLVQALSQANRAVFWFSPASWWLHRRLVALAEVASDDAAIDALGDSRGYAAILLEMARRSGSGLADRLAGGVAMARPATISNRIERILTERYAPLRVRGYRLAAAGLAGLPLALAVAVSSEAQTQPPPSAAPPPGTSVQVSATPHKLITIDPKLLDAYAGVYRNPRTGLLVVIAREDNHLTSHGVGNLRPPARMYPYTDHDFFATQVPLDESFVMDGSGKVLRMIVKRAGMTVSDDRLSDEEGKKELAVIAQRTTEEEAPHVEIAINSNLLDDYVGAYRLNKWAMFRITREGNALFARLGNQRTFQIYPYSNKDFFYTIVPAQLSFIASAGGKASALVLHQDGHDQTASRVSDAAAESYDAKLAEEMAPHTEVHINPRLLGGYVGRYRDADLEITVTRDGGQLWVQVTGFQRYPVYPSSDRDFFASGFPVQITFTPDATGKATTLIRHESGLDEVFNRED